MFVNCFSPFSSRYCPAPSTSQLLLLYWLEGEHDTGPQILSPPVRALFMDTWKKEIPQNDRVVVEVGGDGAKKTPKQFDNLPEKKKAIKKIS